MAAADIDSALIDQCVTGDNGGIDGDNANAMLDLAISDMEDAVSTATLQVSSVDVLSPYNRETVLGEICAGYSIDQKPGVCSCAGAASSNNDAYNLCVERNMEKSGGDGGAVRVRGEPEQTGVPIWGVFLIVVGVVGLMLLAMFIYWKRTQQQMRDQVRGILAEYMPLDDDGVPGSSTTAQFNIQSDGGALV